MILMMHFETPVVFPSIQIEAGKIVLNVRKMFMKSISMTTKNWKIYLTSVGRFPRESNRQSAQVATQLVGLLTTAKACKLKTGR